MGSEPELDLEGKERIAEGTRRGRSFIPLSYIYDVNSVGVGKACPMDEALEETSSRYRVRWDRLKDWKNGIHLGVNLNGKKHWTCRTGRAVVAFNLVKRLSCLPPQEKSSIVIGQLLPILTYGSELHNTPAGGSLEASCEVVGRGCDGVPRQQQTEDRGAGWYKPVGGPDS